MKARKLAKSGNSSFGIAVSIVMAGGILTLSACGEKTEPKVAASSEASQQQPLKQKIEELLQRAQAGDAEAQNDLAERYAAGDGVGQDSVKAVDLFQQAAAKGIAKAQFRLSQMYGKGEGVPQDSVKATDLLRQSAANGYAKAQSALARLYAKGEGVTRDEVLAYAWATLAQRQGDEEAKELQSSVTLTTLLKDEAEQLAAKWQRGVALVREKVDAKQNGEASPGK